MQLISCQHSGFHWGCESKSPSLRAVIEFGPLLCVLRSPSSETLANATVSLTPLCVFGGFNTRGSVSIIWHTVQLSGAGRHYGVKEDVVLSHVGN